jgi:hypothetical protein
MRLRVQSPVAQNKTNKKRMAKCIKNKTKQQDPTIFCPGGPV